MLDWYCFIPLGALARGARIITRSNPGYVLELPKQHWLGEFPAMLLELGKALHNARRDVAAATATGTQEIEEQKARLETVLRELSEGVLVCDRDAASCSTTRRRSSCCPTAQRWDWAAPSTSCGPGRPSRARCNC